MNLMNHPLHKWLGWTGSLLAIADYSLFAAGFIGESTLFSAGAVASLLLAYALFKDKAHYGGFQQSIFILLNLIGIVRIVFL